MLLRRVCWSLIITQALYLLLTLLCLTIPTLWWSKPREILVRTVIPMRDRVPTPVQDRHPNLNSLILAIDLRTQLRLAACYLNRARRNPQKQRINIKCPFNSLKYRSWLWIQTLRRCPSLSLMWAKAIIRTSRNFNSRWVRHKSFRKWWRTQNHSWLLTPIIQALLPLQSYS